MKAVVLAAGAGRRMRAASADTHLTAEQASAAASGVKTMIPVGLRQPRPFLDYILSALADAGCTAVCLVIGRDHDAMQRHYQEHLPARVRLHFVVQDPPKGTADALLKAQAFVGDDPFLVLNSDNLYPEAILRALASLDGPGLPVFERQSLVVDSGFPEARVAAFALLEVDAAGRLTKIVEKPGAERVAAAGSRALVSMNVWRFDRRIFEACRQVPLSPRGEYELPEAVQLAIDEGVEFQTIRAHGAILDLSSRADVAMVSARLEGQEARP